MFGNVVADAAGEGLETAVHPIAKRPFMRDRIVAPQREPFIVASGGVFILPQVPFAKLPSLVARRLKKLRQRRLVFQPMNAVNGGIIGIQIVMQAVLRGKPPGVQAGARRGADGYGRKGVGKTSAILGQIIKRRRAQFAVASTTHCPLGMVVGQKEEDVGCCCHFNFCHKAHRGFKDKVWRFGFVFVVSESCC